MGVLFDFVCGALRFTGRRPKHECTRSSPLVVTWTNFGLTRRKLRPRWTEGGVTQLLCMPTSVLIKGVLPVVPSWWALLRRRCGLSTTPRPWELQRFPADYESSSRCHQGAPRVGNGGRGCCVTRPKTGQTRKRAMQKRGPKVPL